MRRTGLVCTLSSLLFVPVASAQPLLDWIDQFGTDTFDDAYALSVDDTDHVFIAGRTMGSLGASNAGMDDGFIARYHRDGTRSWLLQFGTSGNDAVYELAPDGSGGVYAAGDTAGNLGGLNKGKDDVFLARYDVSGNQIWMRQVGTIAFDEVRGLVPDDNGGAYIAGYTMGNLGGQNAGHYDVFLARFDRDGTQLWTTQFGTADHDLAFDLATDGSGGAFVSGYTHGDLNGEGNGSSDAFLARFDSSGEQLWIAQFGTVERDVAGSVAPDGSGGVFVGGYTEGTLEQANAGGTDIFLARYDGAGSRLWIVQTGTEADDHTWALAPNIAGGVFIGGDTEGNLGGPNAGEEDAFVALYGEAGHQVWITQLGTNAIDYTLALAPDGPHSAFVAGFTYGGLDGQNQGYSDALLARFDVCFPDLTKDNTLDLFDFLAFVNLFNANDPAADCDHDDALTLFDFLCFTNAFNAGC